LSLDVHYQGKNFGEVLQMTLQEAYAFFPLLPKARALLEAALSFDLGYLILGQEVSTLSLAEGQKLKLSTFLSRSAPHPALYLLDEPTAALHPEEVVQLLHKLQTIVDQGHTVVSTEHDSLFIQSSDLTVSL
jgi:excinuclease ABC subunit A